MNENESPVWTVAELIESRVLPMGRTQIYAAIKQGDIPTVRLGKTKLIPKKQLLDKINGVSEAAK